MALDISSGFSGGAASKGVAQIGAPPVPGSEPTVPFASLLSGKATAPAQGDVKKAKDTAVSAKDNDTKSDSKTEDASATLNPSLIAQNFVPPTSQQFVLPQPQSEPNAPSTTDAKAGTSVAMDTSPMLSRLTATGSQNGGELLSTLKQTLEAAQGAGTGAIGIPVGPINKGVIATPIGTPVAPINKGVIATPIGNPVAPITKGVVATPIGNPVAPITKGVIATPIGNPVGPITKGVIATPIGNPVAPITSGGVVATPIGNPVAPVTTGVIATPIGNPVAPITKGVIATPIGKPVAPITKGVIATPIGTPVAPVTPSVAANGGDTTTVASSETQSALANAQAQAGQVAATSAQNAESAPIAQAISAQIAGQPAAASFNTSAVKPVETSAKNTLQKIRGRSDNKNVSDGGAISKTSAKETATSLLQSLNGTAVVSRKSSGSSLSEALVKAEITTDAKSDKDIAAQALTTGAATASTAALIQDQPQTAQMPAQDRAAMISKVVDKISDMKVGASGTTGDKVTLQLHPQDWGQLNLTVTMTPKIDANGQTTTLVTAHVSAENPAVKAALESSASDLRRSLSEHGLKLDNLTVSVSSVSAASASSQSNGSSLMSGHHHSDDSGQSQQQNSQTSAQSGGFNGSGQQQRAFADFGAGQFGSGQRGSQDQQTTWTARDADLETTTSVAAVRTQSAGRVDVRA